MTKIRVFVDTNVIIEAFRINCWNALCHQYDIETVDKCVEEAMTGDSSNPNYTRINRNELVKELKGHHQVKKRDLIEFALKYPHCQAIDDGEKYLFAFLYIQSIFPSQSALIATADKAAIKVISELNWLDNVKSLEELVHNCGITNNQVLKLEKQHTINWLKEVKTQFRLSTI